METIYTNNSLTNAIFYGTGTFTGLTPSNFITTNNVQEFLASSTWILPTIPNKTTVRVECIGGGGAGNSSGGGGGGGYSVAEFPFSSYSSPQPVTVGGSGQASIFGPGLVPTNGLTGQPGATGTSPTTGGGGGGATTAAFLSSGGAPGGGTGSGTTGPTGTIHGAIFGGGGGGSPVVAGGTSVYGGGGGGGAVATGGTSLFGGNGGNAGVAGSPKGGGGGSGASGGSGYVRVITF
jgi:hypothetical protein